MRKVIIIHNQPSPYRLPFFEEISKFHNLEVLFFQDPEAAGRKWARNVPEKYTFKHQYLKSFNMNFLGKQIIFTPGLYKKLLFEDYSVIIGTDDFPSIFTLLFSFVISKLKRKKYGIWTAMYPKQHVISKKKLINSIYKKVLQLYRPPLFYFSDFILCYTQNAVIEIGSINKNVFQLVQAYPEELIQHSGFNRFQNKKVKNILYVGALESRKNVDFLINSFRKTAFKNWHLILLGDGPHRKTLEQLAKDDNRIFFMGYQTGYEKYQFFQDADVLVLVSDKDSWGLVVNEAMMFGLPVIISENVEAKEMVNGNGIVIHHNSEKQLIQAFHQILDCPEKQKTMGNKSLKIIENYSIGEMVTVFNKAISGV